MGYFAGDKLNEFIEDNNRVVREDTEEQYIRFIQELKSGEWPRTWQWKNP